MDKSIIQHGEFIAADKAATETTSDIECRQHIRLSLRINADEDIMFACDGITVSLVDKSGWIENPIGIANIKDIGLGGLGIITSTNLKLNQKTCISINNELVPITVMRIKKVNGKLNFIGAKWDIEDEQKTISVLNKIYKLSKS
ncbi:MULTISPECIES: hypothetical protein [unclassified Shewanella]|uniref:hypothetical protein n=1 Tax=unclassified Shewanella TaxID=196818 RepID=UPI001BBDE127|nr:MULTISPECIES: hypothetical protein [unclassified Shewanella]GIU14669.1 hypothetical protein TUM4444_24710 [Shewanella sp. MBTL60-112-B1]GIU37794.1 hypothetical protein TUM4445_30840 [Shewanella sp. MBTL60-112-B2]